MEPANGSHVNSVRRTGREAGRIGTSGERTRLLVVTSDDPIYVIEFFKVFLDALPRDQFDLQAITIDRPFREPIWRSFRRISRFYGFSGALRQALRFVVAEVRGQSIARLATERNIEVIRTDSVNAADFIRRVRDMDLDIIASVAAPELFGSELISIPRLGCINIHSGRLPHYRGMMPTFWQMRQGEPEVTITVHRMVDRLDAGDVLATRTFPLKSADTLDRVIRGTKREGAPLLIEVLQALRQDRARATPLDMEKAGYFSFPRRADVRAFRQRGYRLL